MRNEICRKLIHLSSLGIPFGYKYWLGYDKPLALFWIFLVFFLFFAYEYLRKLDNKFGLFLNKYCGFILREHEKKGKLAGSFYLLISSIVCVIFFRGEIAFLALSFLGIGDTFAALIGKKFGKVKIGKKSLEGSLACFIGCMTCVYFFGDRGIASSTTFFWMICCLGALVATVVELVSGKLDDNLKMPLATAIVLAIGFNIGG